MLRCGGSTVVDMYLAVTQSVNFNLENILYIIIVMGETHAMQHPT